jgi:hypothetical protein
MLEQVDELQSGGHWMAQLRSTHWHSYLMQHWATALVSCCWKKGHYLWQHEVGLPCGQEILDDGRYEPGSLKLLPSSQHRGAMAGGQVLTWVRTVAVMATFALRVVANLIPISHGCQSRATRAMVAGQH